MTNNTTADLDRDIAHLIDSSENGIARVPRETLVRLRALLTSPRAAGLPEGWKLVPIEPTQKMLDCWWDGLQKGAAFVNCTPRGVYGAMLDAAPAAPVAEAEPIPMLLFCPRCGTQHIDAPESEPGQLISGGPNAGRAVPPKVTWTNPPHRSHLCHACGIVWRPADVATVGVEAIETSGKADTWTKETPWIGHNWVAAQAVAANGAACQGKNCGATDGVSHSPKCVAEHEAAVTGAVAADGEAADDLLQLDVLLANLHAAVWHAGAGDDGPVDYDMAGKDEAKAIQRHVRAMLAERAAVSPATAERRECGCIGRCIDPIGCPDKAWKEPKQHCQNGGDVCLAGNRDGVCCPEDSCDIDDGTRKNPATADERTAFERWVILATDQSTERDSRGEYVSQFTRDWYRVWKAAHDCGWDAAMARASQAAAPQANAADARTALRWTAGTLQEIVSGRWKGAKESDKVSIGAVTKTVAQVLDMADAALGVASQAAAPADARSLPDDVQDTLKLAIGYIGSSERADRHEHVARIQAILVGAAPAEAREPVGRFDKSLNQIRWRDGLVNADFADRQPFYTYPVGVPADAGEVVAPVVAALRKLVHLKSLKDGADRCVPGYIEDRIEYQRDKPKAWDDARAALASFDADQGAQGGKGGEA
ncbi:hypothetical protein [Burkholderia gladioli]|uniref:hypothetical protein n=1 Tax=Burkholderia gladioli TaxID=28095 RepID=UPI001FC845C1|nr:hypothetical protein [Burkholderia gladioli]